MKQQQDRRCRQHAPRIASADMSEYHHVVDTGRQQDQQRTQQNGRMPYQATAQAPDQQWDQYEVGEQQRRHEALVAKAPAQVEKGNLQEHRVHQHRDCRCDQGSEALRDSWRHQPDQHGDDHRDEIDRYLVLFKRVPIQAAPLCRKGFSGDQIRRSIRLCRQTSR